MKINGDLFIGNTSTTLEDCIPHQKSVMTLTMSTTQSSVASNTIVKFDQENHIGNGLSFNSSTRAIVIGAGISKVLVGYSLGVRYTASTGKSYGGVLIKNGSTIYNTQAFAHKSIGEPISCSTFGVLIDVQEGDYIQLKTNFTATADITDVATSLTVEEIA